MKRILSIVLCAAAVAAFGEETTVTNVTFSLYPVTSSSKNTIVAISLRGMDGQPVAVADLVKTANLTEGDKLYTFENGKYEGWTLTGGAWAKAEKKYTMDATGQLVVDQGADASTVQMAVGSGIWLVRNDSYAGAEFTFYLYGKPVSDLQTTIVGGAINLVGNPTTSQVKLTKTMLAGAATGDKIEVPGGTGILGREVYLYDGNTWTTTNPKTHLLEEGFPTIPANQGFWYVSKGNSFTINWLPPAN